MPVIQIPVSNVAAYGKEDVEKSGALQRLCQPAVLCLCDIAREHT